VKVVVTNAVLSNSGDAAIFEGIRTALIREGVCSADEISVHDSNASVTGALYPDWKIFQQLTVSPRTGTRVGTAVRGRLRRGLVKILTSSPGARRALSGYRGRVGSDFVAAAEDLVSSESSSAAVAPTWWITTTSATASPSSRTRAHWASALCCGPSPWDRSRRPGR
jgi:hypothetical protein